jgi:hypothetical protein
VRRAFLIGAACIALALTLYPFTLLQATPLVVVAAALTGAAFSIAILFGKRVLVAFAVGFFMAEYALALIVSESGIDPLAPLIAASCLLIVEAVDLGHTPDFPERAVWGRRAAFLLATLGLGAVVSTLALVVAHSVGAGHPVWLVFGAICALGGVGAAVLMARRLLA